MIMKGILIMNKQVCMLLFFVLILFSGYVCSQNMIVNGDFSNGLDSWTAYRANPAEPGATPAVWISPTTEHMIIRAAYDADGSGAEQIFDIGQADDFVLKFKYGYGNIGSYSSVTINWHDASGNPLTGVSYFQWTFDWRTEPDPNPNDVVYNNGSWSDGHNLIGRVVHFTRGNTTGNSNLVPENAAKARIRLRQHYQGYQTYFDDIQWYPIEQVPAEIDFSNGSPFNQEVRGQNVKTTGTADVEQWYNGRVLDVSRGSSIRGVAGGLEADTYNWKDRTGRDVGSSSGKKGRPTLEFLRESRDYDCELIVTANVRGVGQGVNVNWQQTDTSPSTLAALAADWVYYTNYIVQNYRQGDTLDSRSANIINSLQWYESQPDPNDVNYDTLLSQEEPAVPKVVYWEIGNEPKAPMTGYVDPISITDYVNNYKAITTAMLAEDPTIKVGPCFTNPVYEEEYYDALLSDPDAIVDFISYHPYNTIDYYNSDMSWLEERLNTKLKDGVFYNVGLNKGKLTQHGRDAEAVELIASEWNPGAVSITLGGANSSYMIHALACAELVFSFGLTGEITAANYWIWPINWQDDNPNVKLPVTKTFDMMQYYMGNTIIDSYSEGSVNIYPMKNVDDLGVAAAIWGINASNTNDAEIVLDLVNLETPMPIGSIKQYTLSQKFGTDYFSTSENDIGWFVTEYTGADISNLHLTMEKSTLSVLVLEIGYPTGCNEQIKVPQDINQDCRVDLLDLKELAAYWLVSTDPAL